MTPEQSATTEQKFRLVHTARGDDAHFDYLLRLLSDEDPGNRWKAAQALGRIQDAAAVDALLRVLDDEDVRVQRKAVWALGSIGDPRAIPSLRRRYAGADEGLRGLIEDAQDLIRGRMYRPE